MVQIYAHSTESNQSSVARNVRKTRKRPTTAAATSAVRAELIGTNRVTAQNVAVTSATPVLDLCRALVASGVDPATSLEAYRGDTLCLCVKSIGQAAQLEPSPTGVGFVRLHSRLRAAPPVALAPALSVEPGSFVLTIGRARATPPAHARSSFGGNSKPEL